LSFFQGKNIIITGASSGIGEALASELAKEGANLAVAARNEKKLIELQSQIQTSHNKIVVIPTDVTVVEQCNHLVQETINQLGGIDILINNAGISMRAPFEDTKLDVLHHLMNVNFWGATNCSMASIKELVKNKGSLVAVSSVIGFKGLPGRTGYAASKFALNGLFETIRMEYLNRELHVLVACPGFTRSNIRVNALDGNGHLQASSPTDESKIDDPQQVAWDIMQAIREKKSFMLHNKQGKLIFWLNKFFPRLLERIIHKQVAKELDSPIK
jgi:short-subunit dehydrogenase